MCRDQTHFNYASANDGGKLVQDGDLRNKKRRSRTAFTEWQLASLERRFREQQYMVGEERIALAESLQLNPSQVKIWFQNRRIRWRREHFTRPQNATTTENTTVDLVATTASPLDDTANKPGLSSSTSRNLKSNDSHNYNMNK